MSKSKPNIMSPEPTSTRPKRKAAAAATATTPKSKSDENSQEDAIKILNAVIEFRSKNNGSIPTPTTMDPVFKSLKGSLHEQLRSVDHLYNRFRSLKGKYRRVLEVGVGPTDFDRTFFDLSVRAWGEKEVETTTKKTEKKKMMKEVTAADTGGDVIDDDDDEVDMKKKTEKKKTVKEVSDAADNGNDADDVNDDDDDDLNEEKEEEEEEDESDVADDSFEYVVEQVRKYWEKQGLPNATLDVGLKYMDRSKAAGLKKKWTAHFEEGFKIEAQSYELKMEVCNALLGGLKRKRVDDD